MATEQAGAPVDKLVLVLWSAGPGNPTLAAAPFVYALAARALEVEVDMHFTSSTVRGSWGVADSAHTAPNVPRPSAISFAKSKLRG